MVTDEPKEFFKHLTSGSKKSITDWKKKCNPKNFQHLKNVGCLRLVNINHLDEFEALFDFGNGEQRYSLSMRSNGLIATPTEGGADLKIKETDLVYEVDQNSLRKAIVDKNALTIPNNSADHPAYFCTYKIYDGNKRVQIIFIFNSTWADHTGAKAAIENLCLDANGAIIFTEDVSKLSAMKIKVGAFVKIQPLSELVSSEFQIPVETICDPRFGIATDVIYKLMPEKILIINEPHGEVFLYGNKVKFKDDGRPFKYLLGLHKIGETLAGSLQFAEEYLDFKLKLSEPEILRMVNNVKKELKKAIRNSISDQAIAELAIQACCPATPDKKIQSKFQKNQTIFFEK